MIQPPTGMFHKAYNPDRYDPPLAAPSHAPEVGAAPIKPTVPRKLDDDELARIVEAQAGAQFGADLDRAELVNETIEMARRVLGAPAQDVGASDLARRMARIEAALRTGDLNQLEGDA